MGPAHAAISPVKYSGPKLGKSNWTAFEFAFKMHLKGLGVLGAVENKESKDLRMDNVFSLLVSALEESQLPLIYDAKTPNQAWILLEDAHRSRNAQNLATLSQEFRKAKMKESQTVLEFVLYIGRVGSKDQSGWEYENPGPGFLCYDFERNRTHPEVQGHSGVLAEWTVVEQVGTKGSPASRRAASWEEFHQGKGTGNCIARGWIPESTAF
jgi:hypothetical protein